jgi:hypothetical protein
MTTVSTIIGLTPLVFEMAVGLERMSPLGIVAATGLIVGTFLTVSIDEPCSTEPSHDYTASSDPQHRGGCLRIGHVADRIAASVANGAGDVGSVLPAAIAGHRPGYLDLRAMDCGGGLWRVGWTRGGDCGADGCTVCVDFRA